MMIAFTLRGLQAAVILVPFLVLLGWDPFHFVFEQSLAQKLPVSLQYICRIALTIIYWISFSRTVSLALIFLFILAESVLECLALQLTASNAMNKITFRKTARWSWLRILQSISDYRMFQLFFNSLVHKFVSNLISGGVSLCMAVVVISGFVTIRMSHSVPMPYYLLFPCLCVAMFVFNFVWFPYGVKVNDKFRDIKRNWHHRINEFPHAKRKLILKKLMGIKVGAVAIMLSDYTFSVFDRETQAGCFKRSLEYLITACLSIPV
jgi:hypothetical protein